jgi:hypothetical protein
VWDVACSDLQDAVLILQSQIRMPPQQVAAGSTVTRLEVKG